MAGIEATGEVKKTIIGKIVPTPRENNLSQYAILDLIVKDGRAYLSKKNNNTAAVTDTASWLKITENTYDIAIRLGFFKGTEAEFVGAVTAAVNAASAANAAAVAAGSQTEKAKAATDETLAAKAQALALIEILKESIQDGQLQIEEMRALQELIVNDVQLAPSRMELTYLKKITLGNPVEQFIQAAIFPAYLVQNVIFQQPVNGGDSVYVDPAGRLEINKVGKTRIHVIPANNTKIFQTVEIQVTAPVMRLTAGGKVRLASTGKIRTT